MFIVQGLATMLVVCHTAGIYITPLYSTLACVETGRVLRQEKAREMRKIKIKNNLGWWPGGGIDGIEEARTSLRTNYYFQWIKQGSDTDANRSNSLYRN